MPKDMQIKFSNMIALFTVRAKYGTLSFCNFIPDFNILQLFFVKFYIFGQRFKVTASDIYHSTPKQEHD